MSCETAPLKDHQLSITRLIDAPVDQVWQVMAYRQEEWWCPRPWRVVIDQQDRRPGGICKMTMHGPDGEVIPNEGIYLAWDEGHRFVTTDAVDGDLKPSGPFMIGGWEVVAEGDGTRYTGWARHWTAEARESHEAMGFTDGWMACADQLAEICEKEALAK